MNRKFNSVKRQYWKLRRQNFYHKINILHRWQNKRAIKKNIHPDTSTVTERIAFVIDNEVVDVINCQPKFAAILLSEPKIFDVKGTNVSAGYKYIDEKFLSPNSEDEDIL